jgi:hypothetical protein
MNAMKTTNLVLAILGTILGLATALAVPASAAPPPDYKDWGDLLAKYYDPAKGMNYKALKANDAKTLDRLREQMAGVNVDFLPRKDQLAYWINLYNITTVAVVVEKYPVESIRDISTDPVVRLNVFKKPSAKTKKGAMSLNDVENNQIREGFKDPRIHFAINCAAESCPPIRPEPFVGAKIDQQLDDQSRKFLAGPNGVRVEKKGPTAVVYTTKIMDWFEEDFERWGGGALGFIKRYGPGDKVRLIEAAGNQVKLEFNEYSWKLNDTSK